jgi:NADH-quinone oxidoreductase subunit L
MGGLSKKMPWTFACFLAAYAAIIGVPGLSGFWSKDQILAALHAAHQPFLFWLGVITAGMTAFYMTRLFALTFLGEARDARRFNHAHDPGAAMLSPLVILGIPSIMAGLLFTFQWKFTDWVHRAGAAEEANHGVLVPAVSMIAVAVGVGLAYMMYCKKRPDPARIAKKFAGVYDLLMHRYYIDEAYLWLIEKFVDVPAAWMSRFDFNFIDQILVDGWAYLADQAGRLQKWFDDRIVDGIFVNGWGSMCEGVGKLFRQFQTGYVQWYLLVIATGISFLTVWALR